MSMSQQEIKQCIQDCLNCSATCKRTAEEYKRAGGEHGKGAYVYMLLDCGEICQTAAHFMQHDDPLYGYVCQAALQVVNHSGEECERMGDTDCANACRIAVESLEQVVRLLPE
jgi:hypothetical protein